MATMRYHRGSLCFDVHAGGPQDGEPVVLLHGFPQDSSCWRAVSWQLHRAGVRTFAPDQRGYSRGARPAGVRAYRLQECVGDLAALLDAAGLAAAHVVGHDWGGAVGWAVAAALPRRILSLTVLSTPHPAALLRAAAGPQLLRSGYLGFFQLRVLPEAFLRTALPQLLTRSGLPPQDAKRYVNRMAQPGALTAALNWYRALPWNGPTAGRCPVPTTYLWGRHDPTLGRTAAQGTERYVDAAYRFVEVNAGHWLPETRPAQVARAVLERVSGE